MCPANKSILILWFVGYHTKNNAHFFMHVPAFLTGELAPLLEVQVQATKLGDQGKGVGEIEIVFHGT